jgi:hypothetical protein
MRLKLLPQVLIYATIASADIRTASIYIQPVSPSPAPPSLLAEVRYDLLDTTAAEVSSYEAPELPADAALVRIGLFDPAAGDWAGSTSVTGVDNFAKGYSPHFILSVDAQGRYMGAACRGVAIDAGATRDFGPQVVVVASTPGKQPELNKPVVLSPEGKKVEPPEEKSLLQKYVFAMHLIKTDMLTRHRYWWVLGIVAMMMITGGGDSK